MLLKNFIVLEGIDGAGTTTQLNALSSLHKDFLFTAEPTQGETGLFLRKILGGAAKVTNETAAYIFAADRNEHINGALVIKGNRLITGVREACENGSTVISDRYLFSSLAYQSVDSDRNLPRELNKAFPLPSILFFFDIEVEEALKRIQSRDKKEIYEKKEFLEKTRQEYARILIEYEDTPLGEGMKVVHIDAALPKKKITKIIESYIQESVGYSQKTAECTENKKDGL